MKHESDNKQVRTTHTKLALLCKSTKAVQA